MQTNPKCPECGSGPYQTAICQENNPIFRCFYALMGLIHQHHFCANKHCNCYWIGF